MSINRKYCTVVFCISLFTAVPIWGQVTSSGSNIRDESASVCSALRAEGAFVLVGYEIGKTDQRRPVFTWPLCSDIRTTVVLLNGKPEAYSMESSSYRLDRTLSYGAYSASLQVTMMDDTVFTTRSIDFIVSLPQAQLIYPLSASEPFTELNRPGFQFGGVVGASCYRLIVLREDGVEVEIWRIERVAHEDRDSNIYSLPQVDSVVFVPGAKLKWYVESWICGSEQRTGLSRSAPQSFSFAGNLSSTSPPNWIPDTIEPPVRNVVRVRRTRLSPGEPMCPTWRRFASGPCS